MAGIALPYRFQSVNTKFFPISKKDDKVGNSVLAERSIPEDASVLFLNRSLGPGPSIVEIFGVSGLYVGAPKGKDFPEYPLIWSKEKFLWVVNRIREDLFIISPVDGQDLFWVSKANDIGFEGNIDLRRRKDIKPPQNEWIIVPAE